MEEKSLSLWKYNKRSGMWDHQRGVTPETKDEWTKIHQKDEPDAHFHVAAKKPKHNPNMKEEAPTNATGLAVPGTGDTGEAFPKGPMRVVRRGKFAQFETFIVSSNTFNSIRHQKKKGVHWKKYLYEDDVYYELREYARKKRKGPIIIEDERTGACMYVRYGDLR
jgi:hypothetical protein